MIIFGKIVIARKIRLGTHIQVLMRRRFEHGVQLTTLYHADRTGGQASVDIGIVRRFNLEMLTGYTAKAKVAEGKYNRRVGLQWHIFGQGVELQAGNLAPLIALVALAGNYRREGMNLYRA